jgi:uncharacterized NAD(P)/FAD-binding protein YdhS
MVIAIIGGGPAAVSLMFYFSLFASKLTGATFLIFERRPVIGPGSPHGDPDPNLKVNMILAPHSVHPFDPAHFVHWLECHQVNVSSDPVPRYWVGQYLADCFREAVDRLRSASVQVRTIEDEVVLLEHHDNQSLILKTRGGFSATADYVVLALGHQKPRIPEEFVK